MKNLWKPVMAAVVISAGLGVVTTHAEEPKAERHHRQRSEHKPEEQLERFSAKLQLSPEQRQRVAEILKATRGKIQALREEMRPKVEEIRKANRAEIRQVVTPEQQKKFDAMQAEREARAKQSRDHRGKAEEETP